MFPTPVRPPESPRVRELSRRVQQLIADFQREFPMTPAEIRQALSHATRSAAGGRARAPLVIAGVTGALLVGLAASWRGLEAGPVPILALIGGVAAAFGLVAAIRHGR
jgi:hypothetical protein